mmetsp:Transcript_770/g.2745  ORF Transcript_770/g.2745 Transcript_770/m.2745 type:complete len:282 (-) Transcript_770:114-959(-)
MKRISPGGGACVTSDMTAVSRSSNSPRNFAPAMSEAMSRVRNPIPFMFSGTSLARIRCARPSATAVLPTPGSPTSTGLFFVLRERIWMTRRISSSLPITGSSLPEAARSTRSMPYFSNASKVDSAVFDSTFFPCRMLSTALRAILSVNPASFRAAPTLESVKSDIRRLSSAISVSPLCFIALDAVSMTRLKEESGADCSGAGVCLGRLSSRRRIDRRISSTSRPAFLHTRSPTLLGSSAKMAAARCAASHEAWPCSVAISMARLIALIDASVNSGDDISLG